MLRRIAPLLLPCLMLGCADTRDTDEDTSPQATHGTLGFDPTQLDSTVRPQDDFWRWVNGRWIDTTEIPADWPSYGTAQMLYDRTEEQLLAIIERARGEHETTSHATRLVGALYDSYMNEPLIEARQAEALAGMLEYLDGLRTVDDLAVVFADALKLGVSVPIALDYDVDPAVGSRNVPVLWQSGLGLPDRDFYLADDDQLRTVRESYTAHIARMFELAGWQSGSAAAARITALEHRIAELQWSSVANRDVERILGNRVTLADIESRAPGFDWSGFFARLDIPSPPVLIFAQDDYFIALAKLLEDVPIDEWRDYLRFKTLKSYARFMGSAIVAENFAFEGRALRGQQDMQPRAERGVALINQMLGEPLGQLYVDNHFSVASKSRIEQMIEHLRAAFGASIDGLDWMSAPTKAQAHDKLAKFTYKIGFPAKWRDYTALELDPDDLLGNVMRGRRFDHDYLVQKITHPVDRDEWGMTPQTVNAYYRPTFNEIVFPAAFLQPPLFDPAADDAVNYGAIGAVIGHEFSHGFDDQGRKFDGDGRFRDWWTADDAAAYEMRAKRLVEQYSAFEALPGVKINGELTLGENIADLVGATMAYRAYQIALNGAQAPVIDGFPAGERFFIGFAQSWRGKTRPELLREQLASDPHAPNEYRVRGVLANLPEFQAALGVVSGDGMYIASDAQVALW